MIKATERRDGDQHELTSSRFIVPAARLPNLALRLNVSTTPQKQTAAIVKKLAARGLLLDTTHDDGSLAFQLDPLTYHDRAESGVWPEWPGSLQQLGSYLADGSGYVCEKRTACEPHDLGSQFSYTVRQGQVHLEAVHWDWVDGGKANVETRAHEPDGCEHPMVPGRFPDIARAPWEALDATSRQERQDRWPVIEAVLRDEFGKKPAFIDIVQRYYTSGAMPDWTRHVPRHQSHIDLFTLLWLHPSSDAAVLRPLSDDYRLSPWTSDGIEDGFKHLHLLHRRWPLQDLRRSASLAVLLKDSELMFSAIYGDLTREEEQHAVLPGRMKFKHWRKWGAADLSDLDHFKHWLQASEPKIGAALRPAFFTQPSPWAWWAHGMAAERRDTRFASVHFWESCLDALTVIARYAAASESAGPRHAAATHVQQWLDGQTLDGDLAIAWRLIQRGEITQSRQSFLLQGKPLARDRDLAAMRRLAG